MGRQIISILDPTGLCAEKDERVLGPIGGLEGKVVAILNNGWKSMNLMAEIFEEELRKRYGVAKVITQPLPLAEPVPAAVLDELAQAAHLAIVGLAN